MVKKGDTLIEVTLAVGIFSLVAISVVAVMTSGMTNTQTALETTLAREEIDAQAEALRFIHSAYIADDESGDDPYTKLWQKITDNAIDIRGMNEETAAKYQQFRPSTCSEIYDSDTGKEVLRKAFIINTRELDNLTMANFDKAYFDYSTNSGRFIEAQTYPRIVHNHQEFNNQDSLSGASTDGNIYYVEGLYVLAIADPNSTNVVNTDISKNKSAYYDFYIRTCWYGAGSATPSAISTVIRLYNPSGIIK